MHSDSTTQANSDEATDPWANLDQQLDREPADEWDPQPGERLRGTLAGIDYRPTKKGHTLAILRVTQPDGTEVRVLAGRKILVTRLIETKPQPGDLIGIQFDGLIDAKGGGQPYYGYRVGVVQIGDRDPVAAFKDPATVTPEKDLGLTPAAQAAAAPWSNGDPSGQTEAGF